MDRGCSIRAPSFSLIREVREPGMDELSQFNVGKALVAHCRLRSHSVRILV
jgi:hypothetical protein